MSTSHSSHLTDEQLTACGLTREQFDRMTLHRLKIEAEVELIRRTLVRAHMDPILKSLSMSQLENLIALTESPIGPTNGR